MKWIECRICKKKFIARVGNNKYCSEECKLNNALKDRLEKVPNALKTRLNQINGNKCKVCGVMRIRVKGMCNDCYAKKRKEMLNLAKKQKAVYSPLNLTDEERVLITKALIYYMSELHQTHPDNKHCGSLLKMIREMKE